MKILDKKDWFEQELKKLDHNIDSITYKYILDFFLLSQQERIDLLS